ncbi:putative bifunctional diguanylate cyclase/phosphodiesterase [Legionella fallonii]|uniref:Diguanylate cyclase/phosphodiesterase domain 2 n=1 Tax=Legionella fallonii LLAP-10 TaxID=1212491 RepID=A0A098G0T7_9GAMM|nr:GGDEF domain-containing phosphodiesterase [Legionella fallonii]CEG55579.1 Diguanylate cyclase/phosphodiesterase domain 2 [Legionella fallonii LLAP-10]
MGIKNKIIPSTIILKQHVHRYTFLGLAIAVGSIMIASFIVSYQLTGRVDLDGFVAAQMSNPAIWILDLTPLMFVYWGQAFCAGVVNKAQSILTDTKEQFLKISGNLESELKYESNHDNVTTLSNSRMFSELVTTAMEQLGTKGQLAVIIIEINEFKNISYNFGTSNANNVLKQFADKLKLILMEPYLLESCMGLCSAARFHGEEFALLIPRLKPDFNANELLSALHRSTTTQVIIDGMDVNIATTSGLAMYPTQGEEVDILISQANIALHHARQQGLPYMVYQTEMKEDFTQNHMIMSALKHAIENNEVNVYFQPIVNLATRTIIGAESFVRFEHPQFGLLNAEKFIPLIASTTLIHNLTTVMLKSVIKQLTNWHDEGFKIYAAVNLSTQDLSNRELPIFISKLLDDYEISPEYLKLEFTEKACMTEQTITKEVLEQLSAIGIKLSIDDFCSGYSSFVYLLNFPIDEVKIEKSFILNMMGDVKKAKIVKAITKIAETLGLAIIAEGITDEETLKHLSELGCCYGQGAYFSRPVDAAQFKVLLSRKKAA